jgi:glycosyltransferase involved in cell wall biosynthesis
VDNDFSFFLEKDEVEHIVVCSEKAEYDIKSKRIYVCTPPKGIYNAMNIGLYNAKGNWVWFLNAGDECMMGVSSKLLQIINSCGENVNVIKAGVETIGQAVNVTFGKLASPHQGTFYKKRILTIAGGFREDYKIISDRIMFDILLLKRVKMYRCNLVVARFYENGISSSENGKKQICKESFRYAISKPYDILRWYRYFKDVNNYWRCKNENNSR